MKKDIHPKYAKDAKITCACGKVFEIGSTQEQIETEICSACHPFYTGKQKLVDTARRVEKFHEKVSKIATVNTGKKVKRATRAAKKAEKSSDK